MGFSQKTQELQFKRARDSRGFRTGLEARESQQRTRSLLTIKCAKNEVENPSHKAQKRGDGIDSKSPEGTRRLGPPFPIKSTQGLTNPSTKSTLKRRTEGGRRRGGGLEEQRIHGQVLKAAHNLTQVNEYLYPRDRSDRYAGPVRPVGYTGQTGARDRSDRLACSTPCTRSHPTTEVLSSKRSLLRDAGPIGHRRVIPKQPLTFLSGL